MIYQRFLMRLLSSGFPGSFWRGFLHRRVWTIEDGEGVGLKIVYPQNFDYILGSSERPVQKVLAQRIYPGHVFYDVGANVGFFSLIAAKRVGPTGCVYSFEPVAENLASIIQNAKVNRLGNITPFEVAAGRTSGREDLLLTQWDGGSSLSTSVVRPSEPISKRNVRVVALDDFIDEKGLLAPTFVKIDVEGSELDVIQGMSSTIDKVKPTLLYEIDDGNRDSFNSRWQELDKYVAGFKYQILHLEESYHGLNWNVGHSLALPL